MGGDEGPVCQFQSLIKIHLADSETLSCPHIDGLSFGRPPPPPPKLGVRSVGDVRRSLESQTGLVYNRSGDWDDPLAE